MDYFFCLRRYINDYVAPQADIALYLISVNIQVGIKL